MTDEGVDEQRLARVPQLVIRGIAIGRSVALGVRDDRRVEEDPVSRSGRLGGRGVADGIAESPGSTTRTAAGVYGPGHLDQEAGTPGAPAKEIRCALAKAPLQGQEPPGDFLPAVVGQPRCGAADVAAPAKDLDATDAPRAAAGEPEPRLAEPPMANYHLVTGHEVGRDDSRKLFGCGVAGGREQVVDVAGVDRRETNRFADRRLEVGAAVADDHAAPFIGRASIRLRLLRGPRAGRLARVAGVQGLDD